MPYLFLHRYMQTVWVSGFAWQLLADTAHVCKLNSLALPVIGKFPGGFLARVFGFLTSLRGFPRPFSGFLDSCSGFLTPSFGFPKSFRVFATLIWEFPNRGFGFPPSTGALPASFFGFQKSFPEFQKSFGEL